MAARLLITRILLVLLLSELDYSSAFPRAWQGEMKKGHGYGNRRPLQYIRSLRQPHQNLQPNVHDQVQVRTWQKPKAQIQNQPSVYHQTQSPYRPWSDVASTGTQEVSPSQQSGSEKIFSNFAPAVQQQTQHQMFEPVQTKYPGIGTQKTFLPVHTSQHTTPINQVTIPAKQSLVFPELSAPSLPNSQYPPLQSDNVNSGYYSAQMNPLSKDYGKAQSGQTVSSDQTNAHLSLFPSQYERFQSGQYSAGWAKPSGNNYGQSQIWQPVSAPPTFASDQCNHGQFQPSFGQNVKTTPCLSRVYPSSPTVAPSQYEHPSSHQVATTNYYGTGNIAQMVPTDFSSSSYYQDTRYQSGQEALPDQVTAPSPNFQSLSNDYQTQMRLPGQYTDRGQLTGKPKYTQLFIDDEDDYVMYQYASNPH